MKYNVLGIAAAVVLAGCSGKNAQQKMEPPAAPVQVVAVEVHDLPLYFEAIGVVKPARSADVKAQVNGIIQQIHFQEGEWVEEGTLLYTLEEAPYAIRVQEVKAQLDQDLAHLNNQKKKLERYKSLTKRDLISPVEWDELETQVALYEAMVEADQARLAAAELDLAHCQIAAPIAGYTGKSSLHEGNRAEGQVLMTLTQVDPLSVEFSITEKELPQVSAVSSLLVKVYAAGDEECLGAGKVTFLDHALDAQSGLLSAKAILAKTLKPVWPGQSVRIHVYFGKKENALLIPQRAIKTNQNGPYIFALKEDNTVEVRPIKLGPEEKGHIVVEEGLSANDQVVTEGHLRLFPGSKVEVVR